MFFFFFDKLNALKCFWWRWWSHRLYWVVSKRKKWKSFDEIKSIAAFGWTFCCRDHNGKLDSNRNSSISISHWLDCFFRIVTSSRFNLWERYVSIIRSILWWSILLYPIGKYWHRDSEAIQIFKLIRKSIAPMFGQKKIFEDRYGSIEIDNRKNSNFSIRIEANSDRKLSSRKNIKLEMTDTSLSSSID